MDIKVLYDDEPVPDGYTKVSRDLGKGSSRKVYACFKKAPLPEDAETAEVLPICEVVFMYTDETPGEEWEKVERSFNGSGEPTFMWVKRGTGQPEKWDPSKLEVGDIVDCRDSSRKWCVATVIERDGDNVRVRYKGWGSRWDDTLPITSDRIAPPDTKNPSDGPTRVKQGDDWEIEEKEIVDYEEKADDLIHGRLDPEAADKCERLQLLDWTQRNMRANHKPDSIKARVNDSFKKVYEVIAWRLGQYDKPVPKPVLGMWNQLMLGDDEAYWFFQVGGGCAANSEAAEAVNGRFGRVPQGGASRFFVDNINKLGEEGGFDHVLERLKIEDASVSPINEIVLMITLLCICRFCYVPEFGTEFFTKAVPLLVERFNRIDGDDVKTLDYKAMNKLIREVTEMARVLLPEVDIDEVTTKIRLNLAKRVIMCEYMTKRLNGLNTLASLCTRATNISARNPSATGVYSSAALADWIVENRILDSLMGAEVNGRSYGTHDEIMKKLPNLLQFLAKNNKVDAALLDSLWSPVLAAPPGSGTWRSVFDLMSQTSMDLSLELLDHVYSLISSIPQQDIEDTALNLIRQFTAKAVTSARHAGEDRWFGLELLWTLIQDDSMASNKTCVAAQSALVNLLTKLQPCRAFAPRVLARCIDNLESGTSVPQSLQLAQSLFMAQPISGSRTVTTASRTREDVLNELQESRDVLALSLAELERHKKVAVASEEEEEKDARFNHSQQWFIRLDFLRAFLDNCACELGLEGIMHVRRILCESPIRPEDTDEFMNWLRRCRFHTDTRMPSSYTCHVFPEALVPQIFSDVLCDHAVTPIDTLRPAGWKTIFAYFTHINTKADRLFTRTVPPTVNDPELEGISVLWDIALTCPNAGVVSVCSESLIALYVKLAPTLDKKVVWERFVVNCMNRVSEHQARLEAGADSDVDNEACIAALLRLLRTFLHEVEKSGKAVHDTRLTVYVRRSGGYSSYGSSGMQRTFNHMCDRKITVQELREAVAEEYNHPANQVRLETFRSQILHADADNEACVFDFISTSALEAILLPAPSGDTLNHVAPVVATEDLDEDRRFPRELLANTYFTQLFDVLALHDEAVIRDTWRLLMLLPVNADIKAQVHSLGGTLEGDGTLDWNSLLDRHALLKLLYSLQIVDELVHQGEDVSTSDQERQRVWCDKFMSSGGFQHLYSILMEANVEEMVSGPLSKKCLSLILKLVNFFMVVPDKFRHLQSTKDLVGDIDYPGLVTRLLTLMRDTSASAKPVVLAPTSDMAGVEIGGRDNDGDADGAGGAGAGAGAGAGMRRSNSDGNIRNGKSGGANAGKAKKAVKTSTEAKVVRYTINLLVAIVTQRPALLSDLYAVPDIARAFVFGVLQTPEEPVREEVAKGIHNLCTALTRLRIDAALGDTANDVRTPREFFVPLLFDEISQVYKFPSQCSDYFGLMKKLVQALPPRLSRAASDDSTAAAGAGSGAGAGAAVVGGLVPEDLGGIDPADAVRLLADLIKTHPVKEATSDDEDLVLRGLLELLTEVLRYRPALKRLAGSPDECGLCSEVFTNGLFAIPNSDYRGTEAPPKAKNSDTRKAAFGLLVELTRDSPENHQAVCALTLPHHTDPKYKRKKKKVTRRTIWDFDSASAGKAACGYVGLKNLGCICYMNATNQNFFMVPKFRHAVLQFDDEEEDKNESVMYQLQRMFANLQESERMFYNPKQFTVALKDMGEPTNVMVQKDASEYLGNLFQQMENQLQGTKHEKMMKNVFGGFICNELFANGGHYSARSQPFSFLSVPVKNISNLQDSLKQFISGDQVDYKWEIPNAEPKQLPTTMRSSIKVLPPHLIIHLKRFEFDYTSFVQKKLNSRFEFPQKLNMKPYTLEGRPDKVRPTSEGDSKSEDDLHPDEYYEYELMGIVVHTGTCNSGHYYSFIKERDAKYKGEGQDHRRWFQFNDTRVTPFKEDLIERECFGGAETYGGVASTYQRSRNAFVLFYDRVPSRLSTSEGKQGDAATEAASEDADSKVVETPASTVSVHAGIRAGHVASKMLAAHRARKAMLDNRGLIPPSIFEEIWQENMEFWHRKNIFDVGYFDFIKSLASMPDTPAITDYPEGGVATEAQAVELGGPGMTVVSLATAFVLETLVQSESKNKLSQWVKHIKDIYSKNIVACVWLLQSLMTHRSKLREYLLQLAEPTRKAVADIIKFTLQRVAEAERGWYPDPAHPPAPAPVGTSRGVAESKDAGAGAGAGAGTGASAEADSKEGSAEGKTGDAEEPFIAAPRQVAITFIETMLAMLPEAATNWRQFKEFFSVLASFASLGPAERGYLLGRSLIGILLDFVLGSESPHPELSGSEPTDGAATSTGTDAGGLEISVVGEGLKESAVRPIIGPQLPTVSTRTHMGTGTVRPQFSAVFDLLKPLVFACKPPMSDAAAPASPHQQPPACTLPQIDCDMLTCLPFVKRLIGELTSTKVLRSVAPLVEHLCWEDDVLSARFAEAIRANIKKNEHSAEIKPSFRALTLLCEVKDSKQAARCDAVLGGVLDEMKESQQYFLATDTCISLLMRMAKHHDVVLNWLKDVRRGIAAVHVMIVSLIPLCVVCWLWICFALVCTALRPLELGVCMAHSQPGSTTVLCFSRRSWRGRDEAAQAEPPPPTRCGA